MTSHPATVESDAQRQPQQQVQRQSTERIAPLWVALLVALASGPINSAAFPDINWWPLIFIGTGMMMWAVKGRKIGAALLLGFLGGFAFWGSHIFWLTIYLGPVPWLALSGMEAMIFAIGAVALSLAWRLLPPVFPGKFARLILLPAALGALWTLREAFTSNWPYGGFSWGRLAFSQSDSPFGSTAAWVGISGLSFLLAWLSAILVQAVCERGVRVRFRVIVATVAFIAVLVMPAWPTSTDGEFRVAAVQGNSDAGLFAQHPPGQTMNDHIAGTIPLFGEKVDLVLWPENAADIGPLTNPQAAAALDYVTEKMDAPLVTGTITQDDQGRIFNSLLLWAPGKGAINQYDKIHPVPFAEYLPDRAFWYPFAPPLFDLVPRDYSIGTRPNVFDIGDARAGVAICFDITDDALIRQMLASGANIILAPTNNADFGHSNESVQQVAIARMRAIETGRSVIQVSTVGVSTMYGPDGRVIDTLPTFSAGSMVKTLPLSNMITPATVFGGAIDWAIGAFAISLLLFSALLARRRGESQPHV